MSDLPTPELIILVGAPGSGKSTYAGKLANEYTDKYIIINQDTLKTRKKCILACEKAVADQKNIIIDNTNPDIATRELYIMAAKNELLRNNAKYKIKCVYFDIPLDVAKSRNKEREKPVPHIAYAMYNKRFVTPTTDEGFDEILIV